MGEGRARTDLPTTPVTHDGTLRTVTQAAAPEIGTHLGQFRVEERIGQGGLGIVYRAYDEKLKRAVALKVLADTSSSAASKLLEEARAAASLGHPAIAAIHDVQQQHGLVFIVMELVPGTTLRAEMARGPMPPATVVRLARDIAAGLARAHGSGIVHRDLKPENVMVTPEGSAKILDFGLAREAPDALPPSSEAGITGVAGTPNYMAPEQARGGRVDARADVFSFGVVLYEMLAGKRPFARPRWAHGQPPPSEGWAPPEPLEKAAPGTPRALARVIERCLAIDRADRFADGAEVLEALRPLEATPSPPRGRGALLWGGVAVLGAGAIAVGVLATRPRAGTAAVAPPTTAAPAEAALAVASAPEPVTSGSLCAGTPVFVDEGTVVYARQDADRTEIHRLDLASRTDTALTDDHGSSLRPARGEAGQVVYMFRKRGEEGGSEVRAVPLAGGPHTTLARGTDPEVAGGALFFLQEDGRAIRRRALDGSVEEVVYEAPSSTLFDSLALAPDARWLATSASGFEGRPTTPVCLAALAERGPLDCTTAGPMTARRASFSPDGRALYFPRGESIVRLDLATRATASVRVTPAPTSLAVAPGGKALVFSSCRLLFTALRVEADGTTTPLPAVARAVGLLNVGPQGELAMPVAHELQAALGVTGPSGADVRVLTGPDHYVTEIAFSPDGSRVAFHDATPSTGGLFVADVAGARAPTRITSADDDSAPSWLDADHVVYLHAEKGLPYGRATVVSAAGGEPQPLPSLPGVLLGAVPSRGTLLLGIRSPSGDRFAEATRDGKVRDIALRGLPKGMHWEVATATSPSGRYVAWFSGGAAWKADLTARVASRVDFAWPYPDVDGIQPDDQGRVVVSFRHSEGQLFRVAGRFP